MEYDDWEEMLITEGERHTIRCMEESGMLQEEIEEILEEIYNIRAERC